MTNIAVDWLLRVCINEQKFTVTLDMVETFANELGGRRRDQESGASPLVTVPDAAGNRTICGVTPRELTIDKDTVNKLQSMVGQAAANPPGPIESETRCWTCGRSHDFNRLCPTCGRIDPRRVAQMERDFMDIDDAARTLIRNQFWFAIQRWVLGEGCASANFRPQFGLEEIEANLGSARMQVLTESVRTEIVSRLAEQVRAKNILPDEVLDNWVQTGNDTSDHLVQRALNGIWLLKLHPECTGLVRILED